MEKILMILSEFSGISAQKYLKRERRFGNTAVAPDETLCVDNLFLLTKHFPFGGKHCLFNIIEKTLIF